MNESIDSIDFDGAWKEALDVYLQPFLELCFPDVAASVDWSVPPEPLDKEFQEIVRDAELGKQRVDKLFKICSLDGTFERVLIHIEVQTQPDDALPKRLYQYHHRIVDRYGSGTVTLAVLADRRRNWRPDTYVEELWGCQVRFTYPVCKFLDFDPEALETSGNPAGIVIAAHLEAQTTPGNMDRRKQSRMRISRRLLESGYGKKDVGELLRLIDWLMVLPYGLGRAVWRELSEIERRNEVAFVPSYVRFEREDGIEEGLQKGLDEGQRRVLVSLARKRFAGFTETDEAAIRAMASSDLEPFSEALLDFQSLEDFRKWLTARKTQS